MNFKVSIVFVEQVTNKYLIRNLFTFYRRVKMRAMITFLRNLLGEDGKCAYYFAGMREGMSFHLQLIIFEDSY